MEFEFQVILYTLLLILLIVLIILGIKFIFTLKKVDQVVDDVNDKLNRVDGIFQIVDATTDAISSLNDKVVAGIYSFFQKMFKKKKEGE